MSDETDREMSRNDEAGPAVPQLSGPGTERLVRPMRRGAEHKTARGHAQLRSCADQLAQLLGQRRRHRFGLLRIATGTSRQGRRRCVSGRWSSDQGSKNHRKRGTCRASTGARRRRQGRGQSRQGPAAGSETRTQTRREDALQRLSVQPPPSGTDGLRAVNGPLLATWRTVQAVTCVSQAGR